MFPFVEAFSVGIHVFRRVGVVLRGLFACSVLTFRSLTEGLAPVFQLV